MIQLELTDGNVELAGYSPETTLADLLGAVEAFADGGPAACRRCGECCRQAPVLGLDILRLAAEAGQDPRRWGSENLILPEVPDPAARRKAVDELAAQTGLDKLRAKILYECNQAQPVTFPQRSDGACVRQAGQLCSAYADRPYICRLYQCRMGEQLQALHEMIVCQGTWHAYALLGAVPMKEIAHNPFLTAQGYGDVPLGKFEIDLSGAVDALFAYF